MTIEDELKKQEEFNREMAEAIKRGQAHVYYGESVAFVLFLIIMILTDSLLIHILSAIGMAIDVGIMVDLYTHGFTH